MFDAGAFSFDAKVSTMHTTKSPCASKTHAFNAPRCAFNWNVSNIERRIRRDVSAAMRPTTLRKASAEAAPWSVVNARSSERCDSDTCASPHHAFKKLMALPMTTILSQQASSTNEGRICGRSRYRRVHAKRAPDAGAAPEAPSNPGGASWAVPSREFCATASRDVSETKNSPQASSSSPCSSHRRIVENMGTAALWTTLRTSAAAPASPCRACAKTTDSRAPPRSCRGPTASAKFASSSNLCAGSSAQASKRLRVSACACSSKAGDRWRWATVWFSCASKTASIL
mmetsp:Transcript_31296/g.105344  ORF Transcript_31296/g.105344 Transcript_31296/m.105344 type:complete len:286 (+) Transcript_31296:767-1624(+)